MEITDFNSNNERIIPVKDRTNHPDYYAVVKMWGLDVREIFSVGISSIGLCVALTIIDSGGIAWYFQIAPVIIGIIILYVLKFFNKYDEPEYLLSMLAYKFKQPKKIAVRDPLFYDRAIKAAKKSR